MEMALLGVNDQHKTGLKTQPFWWTGEHWFGTIYIGVQGSKKLKQGCEAVFFSLCTLNISITLCHVGGEDQTKMTPVVKMGHPFTSCVAVEQSCMPCVYMSCRGVSAPCVCVCECMYYSVVWHLTLTRTRPTTSAPDTQPRHGATLFRHLHFQRKAAAGRAQNVNYTR